MKKLALCAGLAFVFGACTPTLKKEDFCTEYAKSVCEVDVKCCKSKSIDSAACNTNIKKFCDDGFIAAVNANKSAYDEVQGAACVNDLKTVETDCNAEAHQDQIKASCEAAISGTIPAGGDCKGYELSCAKGLICHVKLDNMGNTSSATCEAQAKLNEDCTNLFCADGLYCDTATKKCKTQAAVGASCGGTDNVQCVDTAYCAMGTCAALKDGGASCAEAQECKSYGCTNGTCDADDNGGFCSVGNP